MNYAKYEIVGKTFTNNKGLEYVVLRQNGRKSNGVALFDIRFLVSGYEVNGVPSGLIRNGNIKDHLSPSVFGVGILGYASGYAKRKGSRRLYYTWRSMIARCYYPNNPKYKYYGGSGITVCERWRRFDYFLEDVVFLPGFDAVKFENSEIELDKDIIGRKQRIYSPETCCFVSHTENNQEQLQRRWHSEIVLQ